MVPDRDATGTALDAELLSDASPWGIPVRVVAETTSTNDEVLHLGAQGAPEGTLVFAERQSAGRGQFGRTWASGEPLGLWFSLLLRLEINDSTIPSLAAFAAVALAEALKELGLPDARIKAPNDLYLGDRKTAGILAETRVGRSPFAVVGIGLNVNQLREDFPPELWESATSLALAAGHPFDRNRVASLLLPSLESHAREMRDDPASLLARWNSLLLGA